MRLKLQQSKLRQRSDVCPWKTWNTLLSNISVLLLHFEWIHSMLYIRVSHKNMFLMKKTSSSRSASILGLLWRNPKGILILTTFRGCNCNFDFNNFWGFNFHPKTPNWAELWKVGIFSLLLTNVYSFNDKFNASMTNVTRKWELWQVNSEFACTSVIDWV